ncbi:MFS transporter [Alphaproteobacteria bacterium]|nr:MFS transporter [Alphaproteobacteria bacterium]
MTEKSAALTPQAMAIVIAGCVTVLISFGIRSSYGVFLPDMSEAMGWGREVLALSLAIQNLMWGLAQPFAGALAERYGSGKVLVGSAILYSIGLYLSAQGYSEMATHMSAGFFVGIATAGTGFGVILSMVGRAVPANRRTFWLGVVTAAGSGGQLFVVPLAGQLLKQLDWSGSLLVFSVLVLLVIPAAWFLRSGADSTVPDEQSSTFGRTMREASRHSGFLLLTSGFFVCGFHVAFIGVHFPAYVKDLGYSVQLGALALAMVGGANIVGSLMAGYLGGIYSKKYLLSFLHLARAVTFTIFLLTPPSVYSIMIFAVVIGFLWLSTVPLTSGLVAQIFGPRYMGTLFGIVFFSH